LVINHSHPLNAHENRLQYLLQIKRRNAAAHGQHAAAILELESIGSPTKMAVAGKRLMCASFYAYR
jgi:hypothetical protein